MPIFISHSSLNDPEAQALCTWLKEEGWDDVFLDTDPERGIKAGERWEEALRTAAERCEAVIFVVSQSWLASEWCRDEFRLARHLRKRLFAVLIEDIQTADLPPLMTREWQIVNVSAGGEARTFSVPLPRSDATATVVFSAEGLRRLKAGLVAAGLDARYFAWPPEGQAERPAYRGLRPLEIEDAGIFLGRDANIVEALDRLRGLRDAGPPRLLAILGASGAGKSSFLRAGVISRLKRDDQHFLPLAVLRPERAAISGESGLMRSLEAAMIAQSIPHTRAEIRAAIQGGAQGITPLLADLVDKASSVHLTNDPGRPPPTLVLSIDQGEELFFADGKDEADLLLAILGDLLRAAAPALIVLITIRSDSFERLQTGKDLESIRQQTMSLSPMPKGCYQLVIEGPAERLKATSRALAIEPALTQALLSDIEAGGGRDALPLLAFTMERLYLEFRSGGKLTLAGYETLGRIKGSIEAAVERALLAADADPKIPRDHAARLALLRRGLIPWLAGIDPETGSPRRCIALKSEIPAEALPIIEQLTEQHLLATDVSRDTGEVTIEPAHDALLRQWGLLQGWLHDDFAALTTLEGVRRATRDWAANARNTAWLVHSKGRLEVAERVKAREDLARHLKPTEWQYLAACRKKENAIKWLIRYSVATFITVVTAALVLTLWQSYQKSRDEAAVFAGDARIAFAQGFCDRAMRIAVAGLPPTKGRWPLSFRSSELEDDLSLYTSADCHFDLALSGHTERVYNAAFSPDGKTAVTASWDGTARLWDITTGATIVVLSGHKMHINSASFSRDGSRIVTASYDNTARLWDGKSGALVAVLSGHSDRVYNAAFSADSSRVVTASADRTARLWDAKTGTSLAVLSGHIGTIWSAEFSRNSHYVVTASADKTACIWDSVTGTLVQTLRGHMAEVDAAAFNADDTRVVTASDDHTARLWDGATWQPIATLDHEDGLIGATFSRDGKQVATASRDKTAKLWDSKTGKLLHVLRDHKGAVYSAEFSPDDALVVTSSWDKTARLWNAKTGALIQTLVGHANVLSSASFSPDGSLIITASADHTARLWYVKSRVSFVLAGHTGEVKDSNFSPAGTRILTTSVDGTARLWDALAGAPLQTMAGHTGAVNRGKFSSDGSRIVTASADATAQLWDATDGTPIVILSGHAGAVNDVSFSSDDTRIVTASADSTARVWDAKTGALLQILEGHTGPLNCAAFSRDGSKIVSASSDHTARVWGGSTGALLAVLSGHTGDLNSAEFSPDGARVVTASKDGTVRLWDASTGTQLHVFIGHKSVVYGAEFSPDGRHIVSASEDKTARLWDADNGDSIEIFSGHIEEVFGAKFNPIGTRIITNSQDRTVRMWDPASGAMLSVLSGHSGQIDRAAFDRDGERVVTASLDETARIWKLDPVSLMHRSARRDYVCHDRLTGVQSFLDEEMKEEPALSGREDLRNPCARLGPFDLDYYFLTVNNLWTSVQAAVSARLAK